MGIARRDFLKYTTEGLLAAVAARGNIARAEPEKVPTRANQSLIDSVRHLGPQFLKNPIGITGADGATSTLLPSGESLWVFGDTVEGPFESIRGLDLTALRSGTAAIVPRQDVSNGISQFRFLADESGKRPRQILPYAQGEDPAIHRLWPIHGVAIGQNIYVFYHRITLLKGVDVFLNFQLDGMGIARADIRRMRFQRLKAPDGTHEFWKGNQPTFGVFVNQNDDRVYLWGSLATGMFLARTRPSAIEDLSSYEYLVEAPNRNEPQRSARWSKTFQPTAPLFDSVPNEMSAAYNPYLKKHIAIHSFNRENKIVMRMADQITGPWSDAQIVYRPEQLKDTELIYAAKEHPELAREGGRILYVTFVNSGTYVPQMIEVKLK